MTYNQLRKILNESLINPNKPGPMKVLVEINNPDYWVTRTVELLSDPTDENLKKAITLLALTRAYNEGDK